MTNETAWVTTPSVGDYVSITCAATSFVGAGVVNPGIYLITATSALTLTATKVFGQAPVDVALAAAASGDVAGIRLIRAQEASFAADDVIGLRVIVPINTETPVDVSALSFSAIVRYKLTA
jgi:hypothetical protein